MGTIFLLSVIAATIPTTIYAVVIYWIDRYEKEPIWLLAAAFLWGAIPSIIMAFIVNTISSLPFYFVLGPELGDVVGASFIAPPVEESIKGFALLGIFFLWRHELDSPLDGIIYGAMVGMGFAMVENVYYFMMVYDQGGTEAWQINIFLRAVIFGLNHALFTSMTGLGLAVAKLSKSQFVRFAAPIGGWMVAMFLHFLHNLSASIGGVLCLVALFNAWGGVFLTLVIIVWALWQEYQWMRKYLKEEVERGTLTAAQYENACSAIRRFGHRWNLLLSHGPAGYIDALRFYHRCSELAYKKHHFSLLGDNKSSQLTEKLRGEIVVLGARIS
jgi:RsiW-degrading membrane proteinase PrsW (M82 family)